jgi:hypothetical protein
MNSTSSKTNKLHIYCFSKEKDGHGRFRGCNLVWMLGTFKREH